VNSPSVAELRQQRAALMRLLEALDIDDQPGGSSSQAGKALALAPWRA